MKATQILRWLLAVMILASFAEMTAAQSAVKGNARSLSQAEGFTGQEMANIYNESVGVGYSAQSLNSLAVQNARAQVGYVGQLSTRSSAPAPRINFAPGGGGGGAKPFSGFSPSPTTSPYLNLFREDFAGNSDLNYNTLVRPQLQQQQFNQQVQRQGVEMTRRMQSMAAQSDFNPQGDQQQYPTGHPTTFKYYGRYYPTAPYRPGKLAP